MSYLHERFASFYHKACYSRHHFLLDANYTISLGFSGRSIEGSWRLLLALDLTTLLAVDRRFLCWSFMCSSLLNSFVTKDFWLLLSFSLSFLPFFFLFLFHSFQMFFPIISYFDLTTSMQIYSLYPKFIKKQIHFNPLQLRF